MFGVTSLKIYMKLNVLTSLFVSIFYRYTFVKPQEAYHILVGRRVFTKGRRQESNPDRQGNNIPG